jgi:hypothetical protein
MNKKGFISLAIAGIFAVIVLNINLSAQNQQSYEMDIVKCDHYIQLSRTEVENDNLPLAKLYAKKAIQANTWSEKAWANYNDVIQRVADMGGIVDFETFIEESEAASAPAAGDGGSKFEGC